MTKSDTRNLILMFLVPCVTFLIFVGLVVGIPNCKMQNMTPEERAVYQQSQEEYRQSQITRYEVCSVYQYLDVETNHLGSVIDSDVCYYFTYLDGNGKLCHIDGFEHLEGGGTKVCIGDKDEYVIDNYDGIKYLYLTKETLQNMNQ